MDNNNQKPNPIRSDEGININISNNNNGNLHSSKSKNTETSNGANFFYAISLGLELGFLIVLPLVVFLLLGLFIDRKFNTFPIFLILFIIGGMVATIFEVKVLVLPFLEKKVGNKPH